MNSPDSAPHVLPHVLVAYASRYGSTREIAERIAEVLQHQGLSAAVSAAADVSKVRPYDAVVLGSGVYEAGWLEEATEFLDSFADQLAEKPTWLFSSGPTTEDDPQEVLEGWLYPASLGPLILRVHPQSIALFAGKIDADKLELDDWLINRSMRGVVGDYRDWQVIETWAQEIAATLTPSTQPLEDVTEQPSRKRATQS